MAQFDEPTKRFMTDSVGPEPARRDAPLDALKTMRTVAKVVENPRKAIPKLIAKALIRDLEKDAHIDAGTLFTSLNELHGQRWWDWEPETLWSVLAGEHGIEPTAEVRNMVMALQTIVSTNAPFEHWHVFEKIGHALACDIVEFQVVQPLEPDVISRTCRTLAGIRPEEDFAPEVLAYIAVCCHQAGMVFLPPELFPPGCQAALAKLTKDYSGVGRAVAGAWPRTPEDGADPAVLHQFAMLHEIKEFSEHGQR